MQLHPHYYEDLPDYTPNPDEYTCTECGEVCYLRVDKVEAGPAWLAHTSRYSACCEEDVVPTYK